MMAPAGLPTSLACIGACIAQMVSAPSRDAVALMIREQGPAAAVRQLSAGGLALGTRWDAMIIGVESGDAGWLRIAAALREGSDGPTTKSLLDALSTALRRNAPGVLGLVGGKIGLEDVCAPRMNDPRPIDLKVFQVHSYNALVVISDPKLASLRDRCLAILAQHKDD